MYSFFVSVHARPNDATLDAEVVLNGRIYHALRIHRESLATTTLTCRFEEAQERLAQLDRMYCEPDGSFVWVAPQQETPWQVDGNLYDRHERLLFVDMKGSCPASQFDRLLTAFGWPQTKLMFQLTREAVFLDEAEFRRHALGDAG